MRFMIIVKATAESEQGCMPTAPLMTAMARYHEALAGAGVLKGRTCSAYPACRAEVELAGGTYADIGVDQAHTEGNLVSAPAWPAHPAWIAQFLTLLGTRISHG